MPIFRKKVISSEEAVVAIEADTKESADTIFLNKVIDVDGDFNPDLNCALDRSYKRTFIDQTSFKTTADYMKSPEFLTDDFGVFDYSLEGKNASKESKKDAYSIDIDTRISDGKAFQMYSYTGSLNHIFEDVLPAFYKPVYIFYDSDKKKFYYYAESRMRPVEPDDLEGKAHA